MASPYVRYNTMSREAHSTGEANRRCGADGETFRPQGLFAEIFSGFSRLKSQGQLCDVTIRVGDRRFQAHRLLLAASSPYFEAMFLSGMSESRQREVSLQGIEPDAFEAVLEMLYTGAITIDIENVQSLLSTASIFQMDSLKQGCSDYLRGHLSPSNCLGIRMFAEAHGCPELSQGALRHAVSHFVDVSSTDEFLSLSMEQVVELVSRDDLHIRSEEEVFDTVVRWVNYDLPARSKHMPLLLGQVRLPLLSPTTLADKVRPNRLIQQNLQCRDMLDEALISYHLLPERRDNIPARKMRMRRCTFNAGVIYAVGGLNSVGGSLSSVERFDSLQGRWEHSKPMRTLRSRVGVAVMGGKLFAFGGYDGSARLCTVECYCPKEDRWASCAPMATSRSAMCVTVWHKEIYVVGGYDGRVSLSSVEIYNASEDVWREVAPLHTPRSAAGATMLDDLIYVIGGHDGLSIFNTVECFDPLEQKWSMVTPMHSKRCRHGVAAVAGKLFSVGGYDGQSSLCSMECYDPGTRQWSTLEPMTCRRSRVGVGVIASHIYAIGGYDGVSNLDSVEVYDLERGEWSTSIAMMRHQGGVGVAVIPLDSIHVE